MAEEIICCGLKRDEALSSWWRAALCGTLQHRILNGLLEEMTINHPSLVTAHLPTTFPTYVELHMMLLVVYVPMSLLLLLLLLMLLL